MFKRQCWGRFSKDSLRRRLRWSFFGHGIVAPCSILLTLSYSCRATVARLRRLIPITWNVRQREQYIWCTRLRLARASRGQDLRGGWRARTTRCASIGPHVITEPGLQRQALVLSRCVLCFGQFFQVSASAQRPARGAVRPSDESARVGRGACPLLRAQAASRGCARAPRASLEDFVVLERLQQHADVVRQPRNVRVVLTEVACHHERGHALCTRGGLLTCRQGGSSRAVSTLPQKERTSLSRDVRDMHAVR